MGKRRKEEGKRRKGSEEGKDVISLFSFPFFFPLVVFFLSFGLSSLSKVPWPLLFGVRTREVADQSWKENQQLGTKQPGQEQHRRGIRIIILVLK